MDFNNFSFISTWNKNNFLQNNVGPKSLQMWQEQSYMGHESGFISASSTQANSVTGYDMEDGGGGGCYTGPGSIVSGPAMSQVSLFDLDSGAPSGKLLIFFYNF